MSVDVYARLGYTADWRERYWNDDAQTQAVMKQDENGTLWMHTGDEGIMDEDGYLRSRFCSFPFVTCGTHPCPVVGRIKDIIIRGGEVRRSGHKS